MKSYLSIFLKGMIMGFAELIPGVSGGTIALILGIYKRLVEAISNINLGFLKGAFSGSLKQSWNQADLNFLFFLVLGMAVSVLTLSSVIIFFFHNFPFFLKSFFSGLLLTSLLYKPLKPEVIDKKFFLGFFLACIVITLAWNFQPTEFVEVNLTYIFFGGFVAVCAFILPGISGSFILLLLGIYELVILSIKEFNLMILSSLFSGCLIGLLLFIRLVKRAYEDYPEHLLGFFYSLVLLSIPLLWKSGEWKISLPNYQLGYIEAFLGLIIGILFIFLLQKLSSTFQDT
jgi:putative membrane protein